MVEIKNENKYNIGDWVWWFDQWGTLRSGTVYGFEDTPRGKAVKIHENGRTGACTGSLMENCWPSRKECLKKEKERSASQVAEYKESIKSVHDLVKFLYEHDINSECCDYDAKKAAEERAAELGVPVC